jgi:hypothetical protein
MKMTFARCVGLVAILGNAGSIDACSSSTDAPASNDQGGSNATSMGGATANAGSGVGGNSLGQGASAGLAGASPSGGAGPNGGAGTTAGASGANAGGGANAGTGAGGANTAGASLRQELALARVLGAAFDSAAFELRPTLTAGIYHLDARGEVNPPSAAHGVPLRAQNAEITSFAGGVGLEAALRLSRSLLLGAELSALELTPRPAVAVFTDQTRFAWPFVTASIGIGVDF